MKRIHFWIGVWCAAALLTGVGCINLSPKQDTTRFYVLSVPAPEKSDAKTNGLVTGVRSVQMDEYLSRPELTLRIGDSQIERLSLYRWASTPAAQVQKEFQRWCERYQPDRVFYFPPWTNRQPMALELAWNVRRMEGVQKSDGSYAIVEMGWSWTVPDKTPSFFNGEWMAPWDDNDPATLVDALSELLGQAFHKIMETGAVSVP